MSGPEQLLVAELSIFSGPFVLEDVEAVATYDTQVDLMTRIQRLGELSWVEFATFDRAHYRMLDPLGV